MKARLLLALELLLGVAPLTALYLYMFPAGLDWTGHAIRTAIRGPANAYVLCVAAAFVMGGIGLASLWIAAGGRLFGRAAGGRFLRIGILVGMATSIFILVVDTLLGAYWSDYYLYGAPVLVAAHQIRILNISSRLE